MSVSDIYIPVFVIKLGGAIHCGLIESYLIISTNVYYS